MNSKWFDTVLALLFLGSIGAIYAFFSGGNPSRGFFGALLSLGVVVALLAAHIAVCALIGYLSGNSRSEKRDRAAIGAGVGWFIFLVFGPIWF